MTTKQDRLRLVQVADRITPHRRVLEVFQLVRNATLSSQSEQPFHALRDLLCGAVGGPSYMHATSAYSGRFHGATSPSAGAGADDAGV